MEDPGSQTSDPLQCNALPLEYSYLSVDGVQGKLFNTIVRSSRPTHHPAELEEDVGGHGVDPHHEGGEGVERNVTNDNATGGPSHQHATIWSFSEVGNGKAEERCKVVEDKANGDLAKEGPVELGVDNVDEKGEEEEDAGDDHSSGVEDVRDILQWGRGGFSSMMDFTSSLDSVCWSGLGKQIICLSFNSPPLS